MSVRSDGLHGLQVRQIDLFSWCEDVGSSCEAIVAHGDVDTDKGGCRDGEDEAEGLSVVVVVHAKDEARITVQKQERETRKEREESCYRSSCGTEEHESLASAICEGKAESEGDLAGDRLDQPEHHQDLKDQCCSSRQTETEGSVIDVCKVAD